MIRKRDRPESGTVAGPVRMYSWVPMSAPVRLSLTSPVSPNLIEIGVAPDGRVAQTLALGHAADHETSRDMLARRCQVDGIEESLKDPAVDLAQLLSDA